MSAFTRTYVYQKPRSTEHKDLNNSDTEAANSFAIRSISVLLQILEVDLFQITIDKPQKPLISHGECSLFIYFSISFAVMIDPRHLSCIAFFHRASLRSRPRPFSTVPDLTSFDSDPVFMDRSAGDLTAVRGAHVCARHAR